MSDTNTLACDHWPVPPTVLDAVARYYATSYATTVDYRIITLDWNLTTNLDVTLLVRHPHVGLIYEKLYIVADDDPSAPQGAQRAILRRSIRIPADFLALPGAETARNTEHLSDDEKVTQ